MKRSVFEDLPQLKVELDLPKFLVIIITLVFTLILPIGVYYQVQNQTNQEISGQVAGISTTKQSTAFTLLGFNIDLNSQTGVLILVGLLLFGISAILIMFLIIDNYKTGHPKKFKY